LRLGDIEPPSRFRDLSSEFVRVQGLSLTRWIQLGVEELARTRCAGTWQPMRRIRPAPPSEETGKRRIGGTGHPGRYRFLSLWCSSTYRFSREAELDVLGSVTV
jgi:hypothetical protein